MEDKRKKTRTNKNLQRDIETLRMIWQEEKKMEDFNLSIHMVLLWMFKSHQFQFFHQDQFPFQLKDHWLLFIWTKREENSLLSAQCSSLMMSSLKKKTIKRSKKLFSSGFLQTMMLNLKEELKKIQILQKMLMFQI